MRNNGENGGPKLIKEYIKQFNNRIKRPNKILSMVRSNWEQIMGDNSMATYPLAYRENILFIQAKSAPLYHELSSFSVDKIREKVEEITGKKIRIKITL